MSDDVAAEIARDRFTERFDFSKSLFAIDEHPRLTAELVDST